MSPRRLNTERIVRRPTSRLVVGGWFLLGLLAIAALIGLSDQLRHDHPAAGPLTPELPSDVDPLRHDVVCELAGGREGEEREEATDSPALPIEVTSNELYDCPQSWDGRRIRYVGEAVGATLQQSEGVWVQLNDDVYGDQAAPLPAHRDFRGGNAGVGVLLSPEHAELIDLIGGPGQHGDVLEVVGTFVRVDEPTGEVAVIRADAVSVRTAGGAFEVPEVGLRPIFALIAALAAAAMTYAERRSRRDR